MPKTKSKRKTQKPKKGNVEKGPKVMSKSVKTKKTKQPKAKKLSGLA